MLKVTKARLEENHLSFCDMNDPLQWLTVTVGRLVKAKLFLVFFHPLQLQSIAHLREQRSDANSGRRDDNGSGDASPLSPSIKDRLFVTAVEAIEYARLIATEPRVAKWSWMFRGFVPSYPLAYIASELCVQSRGELVDRAWTAINGFFSLSDDMLFPATPRRRDKRGFLWDLLNQLMSKARRAREMDQNGAAAQGQAHGNAAPASLPAEGSTGASSVYPILDRPPASGTGTSVGTIYPELRGTVASSTGGEHPPPSSDILSLPQPVLPDNASTSENAQSLLSSSNPESLPPPGASRVDDGLDKVATADFWKAWEDARWNYQFDVGDPSLIAPDLGSSHYAFAFLNSLVAQGGVQTSRLGDVNRQ